jgi:hypothetical protein
MKNFKKPLFYVLGICAILFVLSFALPKQGYVERSITVKANADSVFEQINTIKNWQNWADWFTKKDTVLIKYEGEHEGVGATQTWDNSFGIGKVIIIESTKPTSIKYAMRLYKYAPYMGAIAITQNSDATLTINWKVTLDAGKNPVKRYFCLFLDSILGAGMERSLQKLAEISR